MSPSDAEIEDEIARLNRELRDRNYEAQARANLLSAERERMNLIAGPLADSDRADYQAIARLIRNAIHGPDTDD